MKETVIHTVPSLFLMEAWMPDDMVADLNNYLDDYRETADKKSLANTLVGQIHQGEQLLMDHTDERVQAYSNLICSMGAEYINSFCTQTGTQLNHAKQVEVDETWSVHSYEGDYNPIHDHGTKTIMGISTTSWIKVPQQMQDQPTAGTPGYNLYNSSGHSDGCIAFQYGKNSIMDTERLQPPQSFVIKPEVGKLLLFPSWLQHMVYPFFGEGERRTVASNLNCWDIQQQTTSTQEMQ